MRGRLITLAVVFSTLCPQMTLAEYPEKPVRIIVPFAPGGVTDIAARVVGQRLSAKLGQLVIVENKPGAGGIIGVEAVVNAAPDGYTLLMATNGEITINPAVYSKLSYNPQKDLLPIMMATNTPLLWVANANAPIKSVSELIAAAKAKPDQLAYSSPGNATMNHITGEWFSAVTGTKFLHVPYKGGAPAALAVAGGEVPLGIVAVSSGLPHIKSGKVKVLGVTTAKRTSSGPDWPTVGESGVKDFDASIWVGLFARAGTSSSIVSKLESEVREALKDPAVVQRLEGIGAEPVGMPANELGVRVKADTERFAKIAKDADIRLD